MPHLVKDKYQTPPAVCAYMAGMVPETAETILEPTPGDGNLVEQILKITNACVTAPKNFFDLRKDEWFDCVLMNPPFSTASVYGLPENLKENSGMRIGYYILQQCMQQTNHVIALMPWFVLIDSDVRMRALKEYGLKSLTALPRKTFQYTRIQTVVIELQRGYSGPTIFKQFNF